MLYFAAHLLEMGYFHNKNEMIPINLVEIIEWTGISLQMDWQMMRHMDRWTQKVKPIQLQKLIVQGV